MTNIHEPGKESDGRVTTAKFSNLEAEMKRKGIIRSDVAVLLGVSYRTIHSRFNGETEWRYRECVKIRDRYFPGMDLGYLFTEEKP